MQTTSTTSSGVNEKDMNESVQTIAEEILSLLENKIGSSEYIGIITKIQMKLKNKKLTRKTESAIEAVVNPQSYAEKKVIIISIYVVNRIELIICLY